MTLKREQNGEEARPERTRKPWEPMKIEFVGDAAELIQGGSGKISVIGGDPGDGRKQGT